MCVPILVKTFPEWLSSTEPLQHAQRRAVLVVFGVFCVHMHSFAGLIRRTPPPMFSDTAITDRHSDITIFQLRAHWVQIQHEKWLYTCLAESLYVPLSGIVVVLLF